MHNAVTNYRQVVPQGISHFGIFLLLIVRLTAMGSAFPEEYRRFLGKLKLARQEAGFTQIDVAKRLRKPQSFVSKLESGERRVDVVELSHLARLYHKPVSYFLD
jgi:hypothetical protein